MVKPKKTDLLSVFIVIFHIVQWYQIVITSRLIFLNLLLMNPLLCSFSQNKFCSGKGKAFPNVAELNAILPPHLIPLRIHRVASGYQKQKKWLNKKEKKISPFLRNLSFLELGIVLQRGFLRNIYCIYLTEHLNFSTSQIFSKTMIQIRNTAKNILTCNFRLCRAVGH